MNETATKSKYQFTLRFMLLLIVVAAIYFWLAAQLGFRFWMPTICLMVYGFVIYLIPKHWRFAAVFYTFLFGCLICMFFPARGRVTEAEFSTSRMNCLRNIALAISQYERKHGQMPPSFTTDEKGNRLHSWRTLILSEMERPDLYNAIRFDEPWDSAYNQQFHKVNLFHYCPYHPKDKCSFFAVVDPGSAWDPAQKTSLPEPHHLGERKILLIEVPGTGVHWMEPRDLTIDQLDLDTVLPLKKGTFENTRKLGAVVVYTSTSTGQLIAEDITPENLKTLFLNGKTEGSFSTKP